MRDALENLFDTVGLECKTYTAARDFLARSPADRPGGVIMDIRLPDMNGMEFQDELDRAMAVSSPGIEADPRYTFSIAVPSFDPGALRQGH
jgi:FixJ family two-component response regulator